MEQFGSIWIFTSFPVEMQPFMLLKTPRFNILNKTMRVLGSIACKGTNYFTEIQVITKI
jgi:hypothetical protein